MNEVTPPKWAERFLRWYCNPIFLEEIEGDIYELFDRRVEGRGPKAARAKFIWDVLRFFRWANIKKSNSKTLNMNRTMLFRNYLKLGMRNIRKNAVTASINIFGLAIGIAFAITIFIFADMQLNMDTFHTKGDRIYQVTNYVEQEGDAAFWSDSPITLGPEMTAKIPAVEEFVRIEYQSASVRFNVDVFDEYITFVDPSYFEVFDFPMINGSRKVLYDKNSAVITKEMAIKYFHNEDPIGKDLSIKFTNGVIKRLTVGAVLDEFPYNNSMNEDIFVGIDNFFDLKLQENYGWSYFGDATFILLREGESIESVTDSFEEFKELQHASNPDWKISSYRPIPMQELSLVGFDMIGAVSGGGHPAGRYALVVIACFLLGMACFNFMNISVVSATKRLKEIALRKVMGGVKKQIVNQFLVENTLQCLFALVFGTVLAAFVLIPIFDVMIHQMDLQFRTNEPVTMIIFFVTLLFAVGFISGAYPAFYISRFEPIAIFKGSQKLGSKNIFSKLMLGVQFFLAVLTIVACIVMTDQSFYLGSKDWGYDPQGTLSVYVSGEKQYDQLRNEIMRNPDVQSFTASNYLIGRGVPTRPLEYEGRQIPLRMFGVSEGFLETFQLRLIDGRFLTDQTVDQESAVVVNQAFLREMDWNDDPINRTFVVDSLRRTIVGVVEDFHYYDFLSDIEPVVIHGLENARVNYLSMRTSPDKLFELEEYAKNAWVSIAPNDPFDRIFQEDTFDPFYQENQSNIKLLVLITIIAIILACLGLYGLLSFNIHGKLKEFGVRKVLGATPKALVRIASRQYSWILIIAFIIGAPLGFLGMQALIDNVFGENQKGLSATPFIASLLLILATMVITVAGQIKRAIRVNPADILRDE